MVRSTALVVLLLVACTSSAQKAASRPAGATKGNPVATVLVAGFREGGPVPTIEDTNKLTFGAEGGLPLLANDTLNVPVGGFLLLQLQDNGLVVRIDEDVDMRVAEIALLGAPKVSESAAAQLERLLTSDDRSAFKSRMIGWHVSPIAANVPSIRSEREQRERMKEQDNAVKASAKREEAEGRAIAPASAAPRPPAPGAANEPQPPPPAEQEAPASKEAPRLELKKKAGAGSLDAERDRVAAGGRGGGSGPKSGPTPRPAPKPGRAMAPQAKSLKFDQATVDDENAPAPSVVAEEAPSPFDDAVLQQCLRAYVASFGKRVADAVGDDLDVRFRVVNGALQLRLEGALPVPACAQTFFAVHLAELGATGSWNTRQVRLK